MHYRKLIRSVSIAGLIVLIASTAQSQTSSDNSVPAKSKRQVAITIDDGPSSGAGDDLGLYLEITNGIRDAFVSEKVPAIMFINEQQLHPDAQRDIRIRAVEQWLQAGLEIGNHTYSHLRPDPKNLDPYFEDIVRGETVTKQLLADRAQKLVWFRYPFLATGNNETAEKIEDFLKRRDYRIAPVTVDYKDYSFANDYSRFVRAGDSGKAKQQVDALLVALDRAFEASEKDSVKAVGYEIPQILLIHCNLLNAQTLKLSLARMRARGYQFISLEQAMRDPFYATPNLPPGTLGGGGMFFQVMQQKK